MTEIHILNVGQGDCTIIKSGTGHVTVFDICGGNTPEYADRKNLRFSEKTLIKGNYGMCNYPTNPLIFLRDEMRVSTIFRFILSHPDMDHMDGLDNLFEDFTVINYWDTGVRRDKPDFNNCPYNENDWDRYESIINGKENTKVISPKSGEANKYFNRDDNDGYGDYIDVLSPTNKLVEEANESNNGNYIHNASFVIVYHSAGGKVLLPGDAYDEAWSHVIENHLDSIRNCVLMLAPHHGRDSGRCWDFLDEIMPKFSILGCASSQHLAYNEWNKRKLQKITQNQAGNIAAYPNSNGMDIYVENENYVVASGGNTNIQDKYGNYFLCQINKS